MHSEKKIAIQQTCFLELTKYFIGLFTWFNLIKS